MPKIKPPLSKASEERILDALETVTTLTGDGVHPTEAIYKVAKDMRIPAGHVQLMVNAVNTGQTNSHRLSTDDLFKKAEEFPLADAHDVLSRLYPDEVKTATEEARESGVSDEYRRGPAPVLRKCAEMQKVAAVKTLPLPDKKCEPYPQCQDGVLEKIAAGVENAERALREGQMRAGRLHDQCVKVAASLVEYFKQPGSLPFGEVAYNTNELFGTRGRRALDIIGRRLDDAVVKRAGAMHPVRMDKPPYALVRQLMEASRDYYLQKEAYQGELTADVQRAKEQWLPFARRPVWGRSVLAGLSSTTKEAGVFGDFFSGSAKALGSHAANVAAKAPGYKRPEDKDYLASLLDPSQEAEIRNIQSEAMLNNLMANDDVIRTHNPDEVLDAYNEIAQLAPHGSSSTALMRDLLRKRLSGGPAFLDSFALDSLIGTNNKMKQRDEPSMPNVNVLQSYGVMPHASGPGATKSSSVLNGVGR